MIANVMAVFEGLKAKQLTKAVLSVFIHIDCDAESCLHASAAANVCHLAFAS